MTQDDAQDAQTDAGHGKATWTGSVRWADAASPQAWLPGGAALPPETVDEPAAEQTGAEAEEADPGQAGAEPMGPDSAADASAGGAVGGADPVAEDVSDDFSDEDPPADDPSAAEDETVDAESSVELSDFARRLADDPRTGAMPVVDVQAAVTQKEAEASEQTIYELRTAAQRLEEVLIGGKRVLTRKEVANLAEVSTASARKLWRALGQPRIPEGEEAFTVSDAAQLRRIADLVSSELVDEETALQMARAIGQMTDLLVVWQMEAMVEYLTE